MPAQRTWAVRRVQTARSRSYADVAIASVRPKRLARRYRVSSDPASDVPEGVCTCPVPGTPVRWQGLVFFAHTLQSDVFKFPKRPARRSERTGEPQRDALSQHHAITKAVACGSEVFDHLGFSLLGAPFAEQANRCRRQLGTREGPHVRGRVPLFGDGVRMPWRRASFTRH
jgi:hypothetical protein